jgi:hypothetical protein
MASRVGVAFSNLWNQEHRPQSSSCPVAVSLAKLCPSFKT